MRVERGRPLVERTGARVMGMKENGEVIVIVKIGGKRKKFKMS